MLRRTSVSGLALAALLAPLAVHAQEWPSRPVRILVG